MDVKTGYKLTEVGVIPEDWDVKCIDDIAVVQGGFAFDSKNFKDDGEFQVVKMSNLYGGILQLDRSKSFLSRLSAIESQFLINHDDVLITLTGTTGKRDYGYTCQIDKEKKLLLNQRVARIVFNKTSNARYFFYRTKTQGFLEQFFEISKGGTGNQANVSTNDVSRIFISSPSVKEQTAIAKVLSDTDALIQSLEKLIAKKQSIKQGTMQLLLTGKKRLPGFSGEWEVKKLEDIVQIEKGQQLNRSTLSEADIYPVINGGIEPSGYNDKWNTLKNTITISGGGNSCGYVQFIKSDFWCGGHCYALKNLKIDNDLYFLFHQLKFNEDLIMQLRIGSGLPNIQKKNLQAFSAWLPNFTEQQVIAKIISDIDDEITALENKLHKHKQLKLGLMQNLLTGKIRLV